MLMRPLLMAGSASSGHKMQSLLIQHFNCRPSLPKRTGPLRLCRRVAAERERLVVTLPKDNAGLEIAARGGPVFLPFFFKLEAC